MQDHAQASIPQHTQDIKWCWIRALHPELGNKTLMLKYDMNCTGKYLCTTIISLVEEKYSTSLNGYDTKIVLMGRYVSDEEKPLKELFTRTMLVDADTFHAIIKPKNTSPSNERY